MESGRKYNLGEMMKLATIYNTWDALELLPYSVRQIKDHVDLFIFVDQQVSNWGERREEPFPYVKTGTADVIYAEFTPWVPDEWRDVQRMETQKRNIGIDLAKKAGCSHFILMDCDELYRTHQFASEKAKIKKYGTESTSTCIYTYYNKPIWRKKEPCNYRVPFICELKPYTNVDPSNNFYERVDPTRKVKVTTPPIVAAAPMHHFSYVRKDLDKKLRNSTARMNINKKSVKNQILMLRPGSPWEGTTIIEVPNDFDIEIS